MGQLEEDVLSHAAAYQDERVGMIRQLRKSAVSFEDKLLHKEDELQMSRADLAASKAAHLSDIREAKNICERQRIQLSESEAEIKLLEAQLKKSDKAVDSLSKRLRIQERVNDEMGAEVEEMDTLRAKAEAADSLRRMYEDARHEEKRYRQAAAALADLLSYGMLPSKLKDDKNQRCNPAFSARALLHKEWDSCPGGLAYVGGEELLGLDQQIKIIERTVRTGGGFAKMIDIQEGT